MNTLLCWDKGGALDIEILWVPLSHPYLVIRIHHNFCIDCIKFSGCAFSQSTHCFDSSCSSFIVSHTIFTPHPASEFTKCISVISIVSSFKFLPCSDCDIVFIDLACVPCIQFSASFEFWLPETITISISSNFRSNVSTCRERMRLL